MYIYVSVQKPYMFTAIRALKNLSKLKMQISSIYLLFANIKGTLINAWVESYGYDRTGQLRFDMYY